MIFFFFFFFATLMILVRSLKFPKGSDETMSNV